MRMYHDNLISANDKEKSNFETLRSRLDNLQSRFHNYHRAPLHVMDVA